MPSERALIRRLRSLSYGGNLAGCSPPGYDPQQEVDRRRFQLAEELLKIRAEDSSRDLSDVAQEALKAAEIVYPEIPEPTENTAQATQALKSGGISPAAADEQAARQKLILAAEEYAAHKAGLDPFTAGLLELFLARLVK